MRRPALALLLGCLLLVAGVSAIDGYGYYQTIEYAACDLDIYQQDIVIHRSTGTAYNETAGGLETWHIFVGDHCQADYDDVRFTNSTGELEYYLWPDYNSTYARFAVRLEGADAAGTLAIHYGNAAATTTSNGTNTYHLFDHFDGAANAAPDSEIWTIVKSTGATAKLDGGGNLLLYGRQGYTSSANVLSTPSFTRGVVIEFRDKASDTNYPDTSFGTGGISYRDNNHPRCTNGYTVWVQTAFASDGTRIVRIDAASPNFEAALSTIAAYPGANTWSTHRIVWSQNNDIAFFRDGNTICSKIDSTYAGMAANLTLSQGEYSTGAGGIRTIDYVLVRAHSAAPPAALTFSGEVESDAPQPFPGLTAYPRDLTGNGHYTDINGNNRLDYNDLTVFFQHLAWAKTAQPIACFDFNGNGWLDYNDVITLFSIIMEEHP